MALRKLDHFTVLTDDIDATRDFYVDVLGMQAGARPPLPFPGHWLYIGDAACVHVAERAAYDAHARTLGTAASPPADATGPVDHIAFAADDYESLAAALERHGVAAVPNAIPAAGLRQLFFSDPNGVRIEVNVLG
jgi:catechol 2,3-dioxygenase-like lactoylglutathione lyase family enzyme